MDISIQRDNILKRYNELNNILTSENLFNKYSENDITNFHKEFALISHLATKIIKMKNIEQDIQDFTKMINDDAQLKIIGQKELKELNSELSLLKQEITKELTNSYDQRDNRNVIMELRAGTGGKEAALFVYDLFHMYKKFIESLKWKFEILSIQNNDIGGLKEATVRIVGSKVFKLLKFESGVHRVQRIPVTESNGKIHTSTAMIAILPEVQDVEIKIDPKDLIINVCRASGAGGQHVNTTDSAVKITHIPTNIIVHQQDERSQYQNKAKALKILKARIYDLEHKKKIMERSKDRRDQIGTGERSERIRTYNFPQDRITDHRFNKTWHNVENIVKYGQLDNILSFLMKN